MRHLLAIAATLCALAPSVRATVLTFEFGGNENVPPPSNYGSRVGNAAFPQPPSFHYGADCGLTPNVSVIYDSPMKLGGSNNPFEPTRIFGDLNNVMYINRSSTIYDGILQITLSADPGFQVQLYSFDMAAVFNSITGVGEDIPARSIQVLNGAGVPLYSLQYDPNVIDHDSLLSTFIPGTQPLRHKHFSWLPPLTADRLTIRIDMTQYITIGGTKIDRVGIDNICFGQTPGAPAPGAMALLGFGAALMCVRRHRAPAKAG